MSDILTAAEFENAFTGDGDDRSKIRKHDEALRAEIEKVTEQRNKAWENVERLSYDVEKAEARGVQLVLDKLTSMGFKGVDEFKASLEADPYRYGPNQVGIRKE